MSEETGQSFPPGITELTRRLRTKHHEIGQTQYNTKLSCSLWKHLQI